MKYTKRKKNLLVSIIIIFIISFPVSVYCFSNLYKNNTENVDDDILIGNGIEKDQSISNQMDSETIVSDIIEETELQTEFYNLSSNEIQNYIKNIADEELSDKNAIDKNNKTNDVQVYTEFAPEIRNENLQDDILLKEQLQAKKEAAIKALLEQQQAYKDAQAKKLEEMNAELEKIRTENLLLQKWNSLSRYYQYLGFEQYTNFEYIYRKNTTLISLYFTDGNIQLTTKTWGNEQKSLYYKCILYIWGKELALKNIELIDQLFLSQESEFNCDQVKAYIEDGDYIVNIIVP